MLSIRLDKSLEKRLTSLARKTGRTKTFYARKALQEYMDDAEDYFLAERAIAEDDGTRYSLDEVMSRLKAKPRKRAVRKTSKKR